MRPMDVGKLLRKGGVPPWRKMLLILFSSPIEEEMDPEKYLPMAVTTPDAQVTPAQVQTLGDGMPLVQLLHGIGYVPTCPAAISHMALFCNVALNPQGVAAPKNCCGTAIRHNA